MGTTSKFALRYPGITDAPNVPLDMQELAEDVEGQLGRAIPCLSTARPVAPTLGLLILETDTGLVLVWDGTAWKTVNPTSVAGGGATAHAQFSASSVQSVATGNVTCAFAATDTASPAVVRAASGAGHQFTLGTSGIWAVTTTVRWASTSATGERYAGIHIPAGAGSTTPLAGEGDDPPANRPTTINLGLTRYFASGAVVLINLFNGTSGARTLEPHASGGWVRLNFALVG